MSRRATRVNSRSSVSPSLAAAAAAVSLAGCSSQPAGNRPAAGIRTGPALHRGPRRWCIPSQVTGHGPGTHRSIPAEEPIKPGVPNMCPSSACPAAVGQVIAGSPARLQDGRSALGIGSAAHATASLRRRGGRCVSSRQVGSQELPSGSLSRHMRLTKGTTPTATLRPIATGFSAGNTPRSSCLPVLPDNRCGERAEGAVGGHFQKPLLTGHMSEKRS